MSSLLISAKFNIFFSRGSFLKVRRWNTVLTISSFLVTITSVAKRLRMLLQEQYLLAPCSWAAPGCRLVLLEALIVQFEQREEGWTKESCVRFTNLNEVLSSRTTYSRERNVESSHTDVIPILNFCHIFICDESVVQLVVFSIRRALRSSKVHVLRVYMHM